MTDVFLRSVAFLVKKKLVKSSVSTNLFAVKQKCINVQRNIMD